MSCEYCGSHPGPFRTCESCGAPVSWRSKLPSLNTSDRRVVELVRLTMEAYMPELENRVINRLRGDREELLSPIARGTYRRM